MVRFTAAHALEQARRTPLIPVFYHAAEPYARKVLAACYAGGVRLFEFTNRGPDAFDIFADLQQFVEAEYPDLLLGAGTIFTAAEAERFIAAGADFIVQPVMRAEVAAVCQRHNLAWLPGAQTLNEVYDALHLGATLVKLFPGSYLGPEYLRILRGPLPLAPIMVTGGIQPTPAVLTEWASAGATCVGIDSRLLATDEPTALTAQVAELLRIVQQKPA
ncbi:bifunctional 4-hydroxy-2-oxoglutarate aldolase/2-dehydro-3-deoxy-phosphogluconate aldolase [Hymenobacter busanensis]|uniref:Bifunctional 4-hydroxy-2-oxoglutarate aldolase/2-dehydro-3-deoxy-phosphogluconate aldolase n=1 Tax=Hymenobacter busanensis TaxID=2607656 RepID=A0A7L5A1Q3_9BACT|nr:bifunctional 4-hydroxy-2-oxoglutarate aldolase/2-dehydro-3-deoxy-phosphogluconate aldolase [Hymenobacter busanensis]KAA9325357.1 bifunctional 4-hydroxy-2-oxoglutarate aldolase/2-dehydro-3-deoxy-phosphogluconate aldolase [Hymenobacter busanensis]QHJ07650.1 bifunctional 4-hydroxy-2-oxoglutarate aldolase/2-dehydro-3-deoxy-phosphogluconate aldolase [Hymenobacter busanensis]